MPPVSCASASHEGTQEDQMQGSSDPSAWLQMKLTGQLEAPVA